MSILAETTEHHDPPGELRKTQFSYARPLRGPMLQFRSIAGFEWNRVQLGIPRLPAALVGVRMLHISDLHLRRRWPDALDSLIQRVAEKPPELIFFTGDFVDDKRDFRPAWPNVERLIRGLRASSGMFAILGNHDGDLPGPQLQSLGVNVITHQRAQVSIHGRVIELIGFPGADRVDLDERFLQSQPARKDGVPRIILSHYPDLIRAAFAAGLKPDLFLAGHTHGGQVCLPGEIPIIRHDALPRRMCRGVHDYRGCCLIVSRGMGFTTIPVRAFCPAEVVEIELVMNK